MESVLGHVDGVFGDLGDLSHAQLAFDMQQISLALPAGQLLPGAVVASVMAMTWLPGG